MLKWMVGGREMEEMEEKEDMVLTGTVFDRMVIGREEEERGAARMTLNDIKNVHYTNIYSSHRPNPEFQAGDSFRHVNDKNCLNRTYSYSSGYASSLGDLDSKSSGLNRLAMKKNEYIDNVGRSRYGETAPEKALKASVPVPIWPCDGHENIPRKGLEIMKERFSQMKVDDKPDLTQSIQSWLQHDQASNCSQAPDMLVISDSPDQQEIVEVQKPANYLEPDHAEHDSLVSNVLLAMTSHQVTDVDEVEDAYSYNEQEDMEDIIKRLTESVSRSRGVSTLSKAVAKSNKVAHKRRQDIYGFQPMNERKPDNKQDKPINLLQLSAHKLGDSISKHSSSPRFSSSPSRPNTSSSWLLQRRDSFPFHHPTPAQKLGGYQVLEERDTEEFQKSNKSLALACKSTCFLLLLSSFVMVIITVSIFLAKSKTLVM